METRSREIIRARIEKRESHLLDIRSDLLHFALINYALPVERLVPYIHPRFKIPVFGSKGYSFALMSVVPFLDSDFHYSRLAPFLKFRFPQTNYRVYVIDQETGEPAVWFFGTTLGSWVVHTARLFWQIPWHFARYQVDCHYSLTNRAYDRYIFNHQSSWANAVIDIQDTGNPMTLVNGFKDIDHQILILTHPVAGYYWCIDGSLGTYRVWHEEITLTMGRPNQLYFSLFERLGLLNRSEMAQPHSIFISPKITFDVYLPPQKLG